MKKYLSLTLAALFGLTLTASMAMAAGPNLDQGKKVYNQVCVGCHGMGIAGAPKVGDQAAWKSRIAQGTKTLDDHAINGFSGDTGVMPAKGGDASLSDADVRDAVAYMVEQSK